MSLPTLSLNLARQICYIRYISYRIEYYHFTSFYYLLTQYKNSTFGVTTLMTGWHRMACFIMMYFYAIFNSSGILDELRQCTHMIEISLQTDKMKILLKNDSRIAYRRASCLL